MGGREAERQRERERERARHNERLAPKGQAHAEKPALCEREETGPKGFSPHDQTEPSYWGQLGRMGLQLRAETARQRAPCRNKETRERTRQAHVPICDECT